MKVERPRARSSAAPTRLNSRSTTPICAASRRHEGADLRQDRDQRVLAQEGAICRPCWGRSPATGAASGAAGRNRWRRSAPDRRALSAASTTGWRPPAMCEGQAVVDHGPHAMRRSTRQLGQAPRPRRARRARAAARGDRLGARRDLGRPGRRTAPVPAPAPCRRRGAILLSSSPQLDRGEAHRVGHGLAMDEGCVPAGARQLRRPGRP